MAVAGVSININTDEFKELRDRLNRFFDPQRATPILAAAIRKAIRPMVTRLREITPVGPTGNLKRAVSSKVIEYRRDGVALGLVGYTRAGRQASGSAAGGSVRAGKDRAFHQWWIEYGTDDRRIDTPQPRRYLRRSPTAPFVRTRRGRQETVRGTGILHEVNERTPTYIASSFKKLGPFRIVQQPGGDGIQTDPPYPNAFFRKSKEPIVIPGVKPGGVTGRPPLNTAWLETQGQVAATLSQELSLSIGEAWAALRFRDTGTVSGTDTLGGA